MAKHEKKTDGRKQRHGQGDGGQRDHRGKKGRRRGAGPRSFWSGTISFGLINVPVDLFPASRRTAPSLRMLDEAGTPLARRYFCPADGRPVSSDEIIRGYELDDGGFVTVRDEELEALEPRKSREIDLQRFVDLAAIPPLYFDRGYYLTPSGDTNKAYRLLAEVMEATGRAGIARVVMRGKEYLIAILAEDGILRAETLRFHDEVRRPEDMGLGEVREVEADDAAVKEFEKAIRGLERKGLDPDEMTDEESERLRRAAQDKYEEGRDVVEPFREGEPSGDGDEGEGEEERPEVDLLETIRSGLRGGNGGRPENGSRKNGGRGKGKKKRS